MRQSVSAYDVAKAAAVSIATVSNVLNHPERVSPSTRDQVLEAMERLGFVRNEAARQLRAGRSRTIGMIVRDVAKPFFLDVASAVEDAAAPAGLSLILCNSGQRREQERRHLNMLEEQRAYGVLLTPVSATSSTVTAMRKRGTPVVLVDPSRNDQQCSVSTDDFLGGRLAADHLLALGHQRIVFIGGPKGAHHVSARLKGAVSALTDRGMSPHQVLVLDVDALTLACGRAAAAQLHDMPTTNRPTAAFCANDLLALGVLQEMTARGRSVPRDLAIVGYDDVQYAAAAAIPITSIRQPSREIGREAIRLLIDEAERPATHQHQNVVFEPMLIARDSTGIA